MTQLSDFDTYLSKKLISGWGRRNFVCSKVLSLKNNSAIKSFINSSIPKNIIARGLGRSYGDAAQLENDYVLSLENFKQITIKNDQVIVGAGVSIKELLNVIIPQGFFIPVSPGSANVTIGGAIAADVHGKNHHKEGSLGQHISRILILNGNGEIKELKPKINNSDQNNLEFWATVGGMGLTGVILEASISLIKIETSSMKVDTFIFKDLEELMYMMKKKDQEYSYSVAWVDSLDKKRRGVLTCGEHASKDDLKKNIDNVLSYDQTNFGNAPSFLPNGILNKLSVKAFNEMWFLKSKILKRNIQSINQFFYPLDNLSNWNRIYGSQGFYQYQFVIPDNKTYFINKTFRKLFNCNAYSFLTVLKRFGSSNKSFLSFPSPGWTLAVDLPASNKNLLFVLEELDEELASIGGKLYLAKDLRMSSMMFKKTYSNFSKWREIKQTMDPQNIFVSDLSKRLEI